MSNTASFVCAIALVIAAEAPAFADDAVNANPPAPPPNSVIQVSRGDVWTYDVRDDIVGEAKGTIAFEVTKVTDGAIETRTVQHKQATNAETTNADIFDSRWRLKDNSKVVYQPHSDDTGVPEDLQVGKSWSFKFESVRKGAAQTREFAGVGKVEAWEHVTLPNGSAYDAFKLDVRFATSTANDRKRETHTVMWFAPAVNRLVKRIDEIRENGKLEDSTEQTLREYKPAPKT
jgi:hypothetical protein